MLCWNAWNLWIAYVGHGFNHSVEASQFERLCCVPWSMVLVFRVIDGWLLVELESRGGGRRLAYSTSDWQALHYPGSDEHAGAGAEYCGYCNDGACYMF